MVVSVFNWVTAHKLTNTTMGTLTTGLAIELSVWKKTKNVLMTLENGINKQRRCSLFCRSPLLFFQLLWSWSLKEFIRRNSNCAKKSTQMINYKKIRSSSQVEKLSHGNFGPHESKPCLCPHSMLIRNQFNQANQVLSKLFRNKRRPTTYYKNSTNLNSRRIRWKSRSSWPSKIGFASTIKSTLLLTRMRSMPKENHRLCHRKQSLDKSFKSR